MERRKNACAAYGTDPTMKDCSALLQSLPIDVCSGDESAHELGENQYAITNMEWQAPEVLNVFRILDRLHLSTRFRCGRATQGAFPHIRIKSERVDHCEAPVGLPSNFYSPEYLVRLQAFQVENLRMTPAIHMS